MNTVLNSYGQLYGCPKIPQKSYKFFCRGLDIRVAQVMETHLRQPCPLQDAVQHMQHAVRGHGASGG